MGNCCKPASSMEWGGEDWDFILKSEDNKIRNKSSSNKVFDEGQALSLGKIKKENLLEELRASADANGRVKLRISKKELEELLEGIENQNKMMTKKKQVGQSSYRSAEQVLFRLMKAREQANNNKHQDSHHHTPWSPVLHTISEVN